MKSVRKQKHRANIAAPKATADRPVFSELQRDVVAVAIRETKLDLLGKLISTLEYLRAEVI